MCGNTCEPIGHDSVQLPGVLEGIIELPEACLDLRAHFSQSLYQGRCFRWPEVVFEHSFYKCQ